MNFIKAPDTLQFVDRKTTLINLDSITTIDIKTTKIIFYRTGDYTIWDFGTNEELEKFEAELVQKLISNNCFIKKSL